MGLGLGNIQQAILDNLDAAKEAWAAGQLCYRGGALTENSFLGYHRPRIFHGGMYIQLEKGVYDVRAVLAYLVVELREAPYVPLPGRAVCNHCGKGHGVDPAFRTSFSRAVATLVHHGLLVKENRNKGEVRLVRRGDG